MYDVDLRIAYAVGGNDGPDSGLASTFSREEYHMTTVPNSNGDLRTRVVSLNGKVLELDMQGQEAPSRQHDTLCAGNEACHIPGLSPRRIAWHTNSSIAVANRSYVFVVLPDAHVKACMLAEPEPEPVSYTHLTLPTKA